MKNLMVLVLLFLFTGGLFGQISVKVEVQDDFDSSEQYPFGRLNPLAPLETKQFSFLIGSFSCEDRIRNPADGKWYDLKAVRRAEYVLNGHAIQDKNYTNVATSTNIRIYDSSSKEWVVSFFKAPFGIGVWRGNLEGNRFVLKKGDEKNGSILSFFDISDNGYSWKGVYLKDGDASPFWEFTCKRKN